MNRVVTKLMAISALLAGVAQSSVIMDPIDLNTYDLTWQNIAGASWADASGDNIITVGENVTFSLTMHKSVTGSHDFDAMKLWIDNSVVGAPSSAFDVSTQLKATDYAFIYDNNPVTDPDNYKTFTYTTSFSSKGTHSLIASVMCSRDLSYLYDIAIGKKDQAWEDHPSVRDWNYWYVDTKRYQGETNKYLFTVSDIPDVPEPSLVSLLGCGLISLAFLRRKKIK